MRGPRPTAHVLGARLPLVLPSAFVSAATTAAAWAGAAHAPSYCWHCTDRAGPKDSGTSVRNCFRLSDWRSSPSAPDVMRHPRRRGATRPPLRHFNAGSHAMRRRRTIRAWLRRDQNDARLARLRVSLVLGGTESLTGRFPLAHIGALLGRSVRSVAAEMVDPRIQIGPYDRVAGTVCFGLRLGCKLPRSGRLGRRRSRGSGWSRRWRRRRSRSGSRALPGRGCRLRRGGPRRGCAIGQALPLEAAVGLTLGLPRRFHGIPLRGALLHSLLRSLRLSSREQKRPD